MKRERKTALAGMLAALGTVLLYSGSLIGKADFATAVVASLCVAVAVSETGCARAWGVYAVIALLSLLLVPQKTAAALFASFFGYYPVLKTTVERRLSRRGSYLVKAAVLNLAVAVLVVLAYLAVHLSVWVVAGVFVLANLLLPVYDFAVTGTWRWYEDTVRRRH